MSGFLGVPVGAAYYLVVALTHLLTPVVGGLAAVAAIVVFTAAVRLLLSPLSLRALRGQAAVARLAPEVQALRTRYRRQPERFQRELTALYKREGASPFASLLPLLAQWPLLSVLYLLFRSATVNGAANQLLAHGMFGVPLGAYWLSGAGPLSVHGAVFLAIFAVLAALCWLSARLAKLAGPAAPPAAASSAARHRDRAPKDPAEALANSKAAGSLTRALPYATVAVAAFAPLATAIYLLTTMALSLAERRLFLRRAAPAAGAPVPATRCRQRGAGNPVRRYLARRRPAGSGRPGRPLHGAGGALDGRRGHAGCLDHGIRAHPRPAFRGLRHDHDEPAAAP